MFVVRSINEDPDSTFAGHAAQQAEQDAADYGSFFTLTTLAFLQGFVYSAVLSFLPRYLGMASSALADVPGRTLVAT